MLLLLIACPADERRRRPEPEPEVRCDERFEVSAGDDGPTCSCDWCSHPEAGSWSPDAVYYYVCDDGWTVGNAGAADNPFACDEFDSCRSSAEEAEQAAVEHCDLVLFDTGA